MNTRTLALFVAIVTIFICAILLFLFETDRIRIVSGLLTGIVSGAITFIVGALYHMNVARKLERFEQLGIKNLLTNRHDRKYYQTVIAHAKTEVRVIGTSCTRFIDHFLDLDARDTRQPLIDLLKNEPEFQIKLLRATEPSNERIRDVTRRLQNDFNGKFFVRTLPVEATKRYADDPSQIMALQSLVIVDDQLIVSPVLGRVSDDKNSPALHVDMSTFYATRHKEYFDSLWKDACEIND